MKIDKSPSGRVIELPKGYQAYLPHSLPPKIDWTDQLVNNLARANFLVGKLANEGDKLPNPHLLMRPFITREAVLSSKIEGTHATIGEVLAQDAGATVKQDLDDIQEVQNYIEALDYGMDRLNDLPLSLRLIQEIHEKLMQGVRGAHATPGRFRISQNWIGKPGSTLKTARFVPPPPDYLIETLGELEKFLHDRQLPALIHAAFCHYQFEAIHPFLDGNGRVGRLLITLLLIEQKVLPSPLLYLSAFFEATRHDYYRYLFRVSSEGAWADWLMYFLNGVAVQSEDALSRSTRINELLSEWKLQVAGVSSKTPLNIVDHFATNPYLTVKKVSDQLKIAYSTAERGIRKLLDKNIITQVSSDKRNKVYCATKILDILEEPTQIHSSE